MLTEILVVVLVLAAVLAIGMHRESQRQRRLEAWTRARPGARLHWPFRPEEHAIPTEALVTGLLGRAPMGWAAAVELHETEGVVWFVEYRSTPPGRKSPLWFTLVAVHRPGGAGEREPWACRTVAGLISTELLERERGGGAAGAAK